MRRARRSISQLNVVPYVDVMLVLLVIFMVTTPMMQPSVIDLPQVDKAERDITELPLRITITADDHYLVVDHQQQSRHRTQAELMQAVLPKLGHDQARPVVIAADKTVRYERVIEVMSALKQANIARVGLLVQQKR